MATFDYTSRDYFSIREDLFDRAAAMPIGVDWTTRSTSDFGVMLVDLWAYMADVLHYYVDRAAAETYLSTATQRESVLALANLLDYVPTPLGSAMATVTLSPTSAFTTTVVIPEGTAFVAPARDNTETTVYFVTTDTASMSSSTSSIVINVVEGTREFNESPVHYVTSFQNKSSGAPNQKFTLRYKNVVPSSVEVNVYEGPLDVSNSPSAVPYLYTPKLADYASTDNVFTVETSADGTVQIVFGNGINGKIPSKDAEVKVTYRRSTGLAGNISANRITSFVNSTPVGVQITYSTSSTGGYDEESIASLKANVPLLFRTQDRAVSLQDFKDLALRIPGVVKATAEVISGTSTVRVYPIEYQPNYVNSASSTLPISSTLQAETLTYFEPRTMIGASVMAAASVSLTPVYVRADIYVLDGYSQKLVLSDVTTAIDNLLTFDNISFGQTLSLGEIYRVILGVSGVDYAYISTFNTTDTPNSIIANHKITASAISLLRKGGYTLNPVGGVVG